MAGGMGRWDPCPRCQLDRRNVKPGDLNDAAGFADDSTCETIEGKGEMSMSAGGTIGSRKAVTEALPYQGLPLSRRRGVRLLVLCPFCRKTDDTRLSVSGKPLFVLNGRECAHNHLAHVIGAVFKTRGRQSLRPHAQAHLLKRAELCSNDYGCHIDRWPASGHRASASDARCQTPSPLNALRAIFQ